MSTTHASLDAAANERKLRLAKLKSLKRKQPDPSADDDSALEPQITSNTNGAPKSPSPSPDVTSTYLSGRNYDPETRGPKLGFESAPTADQITLEDQANSIATSTKALADKEAIADKPIDLFQLQPKKPNWDLKRDLGRKMEVLNVRTENAIARLVRERIANAQKTARAGGKSEEGEVMGIEGSTLVEGVHVREREEEEDERREREDEEIA
ncbi:MAG: hypothetical protein M1812_006872 [Candelaria pacifica]|nr:MAG: hypothetical protein M1812_006872 [Candelaria pacifica]